MLLTISTIFALYVICAITVWTVEYVTQRGAASLRRTPVQLHSSSHNKRIPGRLSMTWRSKAAARSAHPSN